ncbi:hypothetical protein [Sediminibacterium soli]|uniref:hypothetical protein n=1 Tax=Sediminibacterium soli TaxID=2698829 RepID=UPI00137AF120|nr:hypothetical protein [Sediminibacterium soli]NCI47832.1 hypothetical protein [Sediminibacterium soli]
MQMHNYLDYELSELIDMLAEHTACYTHMMNEGTHQGESFSQIGEQILAIQKAIWTKMGFNGQEQRKSETG